MRKLTEAELTLIQKSIIRKEISSAEILTEIYDHYLSHLQSVVDEQFSQDLYELDQKFTYGYCHALQSRFNKEAKANIGKTQWMVIRKYFCTSRVIYLLGILSIVFYISSQARTQAELEILMISPLLLLVIASIAFNYQNWKKLKPVKKTFKEIGMPIYSSLALPISERMYMSVLITYSLLYIPQLIYPNKDLNLQLPAISAIITILLSLYTVSLLEVWKIKSKMALI